MRLLAWRPNPFTVISFAILAADQVLDLLIEFAVPEGSSSMLVPGWLGIMRLPGPRSATLDTNAFFVLLAIALVPLLWWYKRRIRPDTLYRVAVTIVLGGLLGNLADGMRLGYPADYLLMGNHLNLADMALFVGGSLLVFRVLKGETKQHV